MVITKTCNITLSSPNVANKVVTVNVHDSLVPPVEPEEGLVLHFESDDYKPGSPWVDRIKGTEFELYLNEESQGGDSLEKTDAGVYFPEGAYYNISLAGTGLKDNTPITIEMELTSEGDAEYRTLIAIMKNDADSGSPQYKEVMKIDDRVLNKTNKVVCYESQSFAPYIDTHHKLVLSSEFKDNTSSLFSACTGAVNCQGSSCKNAKYLGKDFIAISSYGMTSTKYFKGWIKTLKVYNYVLTPEEILYTANNMGQGSSLKLADYVATVNGLGFSNVKCEEKEGKIVYTGGGAWVANDFINNISKTTPIVLNPSTSYVLKLEGEFTKGTLLTSVNGTEVNLQKNLKSGKNIYTFTTTETGNLYTMINSADINSPFSIEIVEIPKAQA